MTWLILILVLAMVIGPVMYLVPSARDKRLAELRSQARIAGLGVKLSTLPKLDPSADERVSAGGVIKEAANSCVAYQLPIQGQLPTVTQFTLLRIPEQPTVTVNEVLPGWSLHGESDTAFWQSFVQQESSHRVLMDCLSALPQDTLGMELTDRYAACLWLEKTAGHTDGGAAVVQSIKSGLLIIVEHLVQRYGKSLSQES